MTIKTFHFLKLSGYYNDLLVKKQNTHTMKSYILKVGLTDLYLYFYEIKRLLYEQLYQVASEVTVVA